MVERRICVAGRGGSSVCVHSLGSRAVCVLAGGESEISCSRASEVSGRPEDDGLGICCGMRALFSPLCDRGVGFLSDASFCDSPISSRLSLCHHSYR